MQPVPTQQTLIGVVLQVEEGTGKGWHRFSLCKTEDSQNVSCSSSACAGGADRTISFKHKLTTASQARKARQQVFVLQRSPACPAEQVMKTLSINQEVIHMDPGPDRSRACMSNGVAA